MSLEIEVTCSNHQRDGWGKRLELVIDRVQQLDPRELKKRIERHNGWIVQFNGNNIDTYCSRKCAE